MWQKYITGTVEVEVCQRTYDLDMIMTPSGPLISLESIERALELTHAQRKKGTDAVAWTDVTRGEVQRFSENNAIGSRFCKLYLKSGDTQRSPYVGPCAAIEFVEKLEFTNDKTTAFVEEMERIYAPFLDRIVRAEDDDGDNTDQRKEEKALELEERRLTLAERQEQFLMRQVRVATDTTIPAEVRSRLSTLEPFSKRLRQ